MSSVKPKQYGQGPHSYFQRLLRDGARPFIYQPQAKRLLGKRGTPVVQPLAANQVSFLSFHYQNALSDRDPINGIANITRTGDSFESTDGNVYSSAPENELGENRQDKYINPSNALTEARGNGVHNTQNKMTVLSWLEQMQARQPVLFQDVSVNNEERNNKHEITQAEVAVDTSLSAPGHHVMLKPDQKLAMVSDESPAPVAPLSFQVPTQFSRVLAAKDKSSTTAEKNAEDTYQSISIDLPDNSRPKVSQLGNTDDTSLFKHSQALAKQTSMPEIKQINQSKQTSMPEVKQINQSEQKRSKSNDMVVLAAGNNGDVQNKIQIKPRNPESLPITKPNGLSQGISMTKLQQALQTRTKSFSSSAGEKSSPERGEEPVIPQKQRVQPQVLQHVMIVNPPAGSNQSAAFWERIYRSRIGPRSYK